MSAEPFVSFNAELDDRRLLRLLSLKLAADHAELAQAEPGRGLVDGEAVLRLAELFEAWLGREITHPS